MKEGTPPLRVLGVIPARLQSQRLPRKVLREVAGHPLLFWVHQAALACPELERVVVAVDSPEVAELCQRNGWEWRMTSPALPSGTDRLFAISQEIGAEIYVNVQGDEPLLKRSHITALLAPFAKASVDVSTLRIPCSEEEVHDPNAVKVVTGADSRALYFSRAPIPFDRDKAGGVQHWKHLGLYAYRREALARFAQLKPGYLEQVERLEQLRLLENGLSIHVAQAPEGSVGVDTEEDLRRVELLLQALES